MKSTLEALSVVMMAALLAGCWSPRAVFVPSAKAPVRAGPDMYGHIYMWNGAAWELSGNEIKVPEGLYILDSGEELPESSPTENKTPWVK